jgi:hypothetical protein
MELRSLTLCSADHAEGGRTTMASVIRTFGALLGSALVGLIVAGIGGQLLPESPQPNQAVQDSLQGKPFDTLAAQEWLEANRRPGRLLVWVALPIAAVAMGATAAGLSVRAWPFVATAAVLFHMTALNWGSKLDSWTLQMTALYVAASLLGGWAVSAIRRRPSARRT